MSSGVVKHQVQAVRSHSVEIGTSARRNATYLLAPYHIALARLEDDSITTARPHYTPTGDHLVAREHLGEAPDSVGRH